MIVDPINDVECLGQLTVVVRELAPTTLVRTVARHLGARLGRRLAATKPQRTMTGTSRCCSSAATCRSACASSPTIPIASSAPPTRRCCWRSRAARTTARRARAGDGQPPVAPHGPGRETRRALVGRRSVLRRRRAAQLDWSVRERPQGRPPVIGKPILKFYLGQSTGGKVADTIGGEEDCCSAESSSPHQRPKKRRGPRQRRRRHATRPTGGDGASQQFGGDSKRRKRWRPNGNGKSDARERPAGKGTTNARASAVAPAAAGRPKPVREEIQIHTTREGSRNAAGTTTASGGVSNNPRTNKLLLTGGAGRRRATLMVAEKAGLSPSARARRPVGSPSWARPCRRIRRSRTPFSRPDSARPASRACSCWRDVAKQKTADAPRDAPERQADGESPQPFVTRSELNAALSQLADKTTDRHKRTCDLVTGARGDRQGPA